MKRVPAYQGPDSDFSDQSCHPKSTVETGELIDLTIIENYKANKEIIKECNLLEK